MKEVVEEAKTFN